ncbi:MAG: tRNA pseudouridine(55) synthase TruB [Proteobacteria bacterium]|jgi:tRNA pseudouridine55 synthase|nr:tRNA pseudouridine(55) synthase TruB [Pseudomonadota bacterium]
MFHGLALIHKEEGYSSHDVVAIARKSFQTKSIGHAGTLDPLATGLLVLLVGEGTKISQYLLEKDKSYEVTAKLGQETDTLDITGQVLSQKQVTVTEGDIKTAGESLVGSFHWPIPMFSAAKVDGKKLYEIAREGKIIEVPRKEMNFFEVKYLGLEGGLPRFFIHCSKGTFIRTWVSQLGKALGCGATMQALVRTASTPYQLSQALSMEQLKALSETPSGEQNLPGLIPLPQCLPQTPLLRVRGQDEALLKNGALSHDLRRSLIQVFNPEIHQIARILGSQEELLAIVGLEEGQGFKIFRVFRY